MTTVAHPHAPGVVLGVDTHKEFHVAVVIDTLGRKFDTGEFRANRDGYRRLLRWARSFGPIASVGMEGTASYGAGLTRMLRGAGLHVIDVQRPDRRRRRNTGKSDPIDAEAAARVVLSGEAKAQAKACEGPVEAIRQLQVVRTSAVKARTEAANIMQALVVGAPAALREELESLTTVKLARQAARFRPGELTSAESATKAALRSIAQRYLDLHDEVGDLDRRLKAAVEKTAPGLVTRFGVGPQCAAKLLMAAGDNPERLRGPASLAKLCGAAPLDCSSGQNKRHRLNRGGNRQANSALYTIVIVRMRYDERTKAYVGRRTSEGKSKAEIIRCLKYYVAREVYPDLADMAGELEPAA